MNNAELRSPGSEAVGVLLIEDNPGDARLIREMLIDVPTMSFAVDPVDSLEAGLARLKEKKYDVILTDLNLPDSSGLATFLAVYSKVPKLPIVVLTGLSDESFGVQTVQEGAQDYLVKQDVTSSLLGRTVRYAIERNRLRLAHDELIYVMTHEMRTPLTVIGEIDAQLIEGLYGELTEEQKTILKMSEENTARMSRLINNLLDIAKMESGKLDLRKEPVDIAELVKRVMAGFSVQVKDKALELQAGLPPGKVEVLADRDKITQVFVNLIGNAIKYTVRGSIQVSVEEKGDTVECRISDTGIGFSKEDLPKVFGKFEQFQGALASKQKGSGLGLYITKQIVELHNGNIRVESSPDQGSRFIFSIPRK